MGSYDLLGHVHGKRSVSVTKAAPEVGSRWREFLWQNVLGDTDLRMADRIVSAFASDPKLGLVFPEDPNLLTWGRNHGLAAGIADRLGIRSPLPNNFDFPAGVMFWARTAALEPLFALGLDWSENPAGACSG